MMPDVKQLISDYLKHAKLMQLATSNEDQPWVCSVWFAYDSDLNLYWFSSTKRRHSEEVLKNSRVAGAIVLNQTPDDAPRGVQFSGTAQMVTEKSEVEKIISLYSTRIFARDKVEKFMKENSHVFYKIKVSKYVLFDTVNFPENSRRELVL